MFDWFTEQMDDVTETIQGSCMTKSGMEKWGELHLIFGSTEYSSALLCSYVLRDVSFMKQTKPVHAETGYVVMCIICCMAYGSGLRLHRKVLVLFILPNTLLSLFISKFCSLFS